MKTSNPARIVDTTNVTRTRSVLQGDKWLRRHSSSQWSNIREPTAQNAVDNTQHTMRKHVYPMLRSDDGSKGSVGSTCRACCHAMRMVATWKGVLKTYAMIVGMECRGDNETLIREQIKGKMENPREA
jgi:hypothetical protein